MDSGFELSPELMGAPSQGSFYASPTVGGAAASNPDQVASQFEAIFYRMFFQQMREAKLEDPLLDGGSGMEQLRAMQHDEMASHLGKAGHLGIKDMILEEIKRQGQGMDPSTLQKGIGLLKPAKGSA